MRDRLNKKIDDTITERSLGGTDYDVWSQTTQLLRILPIIITYCHVKGHQADTLYKQCGTTGPLDQAAHYNEFCDKLAEKTREQNGPLLQKHMHPASMAGLFTGKTFVTASAHKKITNHLTESNLIAYVKTKHNMTDKMMDLIDWEAFERYHKSMPNSKRVKISKYVHDWQNVGVPRRRKLTMQQKYLTKIDKSMNACMGVD